MEGRGMVEQEGGASVGDFAEFVLSGFESPRGRLIRIEIYVAGTVVFLSFLIFAGSFRRRIHNPLFRLLTWSSYLLCNGYLLSYSMGLMQSAPFNNQLFAVWGMFLLIALASADSFSAYSLEDNEQRPRYLLNLSGQLTFLGFLVGYYGSKTQFAVPLWLLFVLVVIKTDEIARALTLATIPAIVEDSKIITDFMAYEHKMSNQNEEIDPGRMKGYNYLVFGFGKRNIVSVDPPRYEIKLEISDVITIHKIWQCRGRLLTSGDPDDSLKDICLSYALFLLLRRRFAGYPLHESWQEKTWNLVRYGLLSDEDDHERAFRVIEVELAFLFDSFYTKYPAIFRHGFGTVRKIIGVLIAIISFWVAVIILRDYQPPPNGVNLGIIDKIVTVVVIVGILIVEIVQLYLSLTSNWAKVRWICAYVAKPSYQSNKWCEKIIKNICHHREWLAPWERKLSQYSLLKSFDYIPSKWLYNRLVINFITKPRNGQKESARIKLSTQVKKAIIRSLKINGQKLWNGEAVLRRNGLENKIWACQLATPTHVLMVWHIATNLCDYAFTELVSSMEQNANNIPLIATRKNNRVAIELSNYCAYLVGFAPKLFSEHAYVTQFIFDHVVDEATSFLKGCKTMKSRYERMMKLGGEEDTQERVLKQGAKLGRELIEEITDLDVLWKILAELWAELMLFVASSGDEIAHAESLVFGGEFVTHLWALLSHAGIIGPESDVGSI